MLLMIVALSLAAQPSKRPADHVVGQEIYDRSCWICHGATLAGDGPAVPALGFAVPDLQGALDYTQLDPLVDVVMHGQGDMPAFSTEVDRPTARRVLVYMERLDAGTIDPTDHSPDKKKPKATKPELDDDELEEGGDEGGGEGDDEGDDEGDGDVEEPRPKRLPI